MSAKSLFKRFFKSPAGSTLICFLAASYIRLVYYTSLHRMDMPESVKPYMRGEKTAIFAFWHGRMLLMPMIHPPKRKMHVLISTHRDGEMIARTMHRFGFGTVRGSTTRGGVGAGKGAVDALKSGENVSVTPDGPKGPVMEVQPGILGLAEMAGVPIIPVTFSSTRARPMRSWDRFLLAYPFGTAYFAIGAPMTGATKESLEMEMNRLVALVDKRANI